jgi:hypothetical protein
VSHGRGLSDTRAVAMTARGTFATEVGGLYSLQPCQYGSLPCP